jgi:hypothetical protein
VPALGAPGLVVGGFADQVRVPLDHKLGVSLTPLLQRSQ